MAHFAVLDGSNIVTAVNVIANEDCLDGESESEAVGIAFCESLFGAGSYKQTSYNNNFRKQFAEIGGTYDAVKDKFIKEQPYPSWVLNADDDWESPLGANPTVDLSNKSYEWDESAYQADNSTGWVETIMELQ